MLKLQKELEAKVHEQLHTNIYLLTVLYPPTAEFQNVFKKDMFAKSNKAAFHQVIHFLLNVLDAEAFKLKIPSWPIYEIRHESQFRNDIMKYMNELNSLYEDANIPVIMSSHLLMPGGFKFSKFMLKLSQLVISEHLRKNSVISNYMLQRIRPNKSRELTDININRLNMHTQELNVHVRDAKLEFSKLLSEYQREADLIVKQQSAINNQAPLLRTKCNDLELRTYRHLNAPMQETQAEKTKVLFNIGEKFKKVDKLRTYYCNNDLSLIYKPADDACEKQLDLILFFEEFNSLMNTKCMQIRTLSDYEVTMNVEKYEGINTELSQSISSFNDTHKKMMNLLVELGNCDVEKSPVSKVACNLNDDFEVLNAPDSTVLALPLEDTSLEDIGEISLNLC